MKLNDLEDIVAQVARELFYYRYPNDSPVYNAKAMQSTIDDAAFVINSFIKHFNAVAESETK